MAAPGQPDAGARTGNRARDAAGQTVGSGAARGTRLYVTTAPSAENAFALFAGEWSSKVPGYATGGGELFDDARIKWLGEKFDFKGKSVLELGPLEAGHTYMLSTFGASPITAIEANARAYMKCLMVKETLGINARFLLGDFREYLSTTSDRYDFILASGVLYHLTDPVAALGSMARISDHIGIWTHYFDPEVIAAKPHLSRNFSMQPETETALGVSIEKHRQRYRDAVQWNGFCGGSAHDSCWLTKRSLLDYLTALGFIVETTMDHPNHPNGPCILLYAQRRNVA